MMNPLKLMLPLTALALSACNPTAPLPDERPPLEGATIGGPFELTDSSGKPTKWSDFNGKYRIVYFGFAFCPDICPTDLARTTLGLQNFAKSDRERAALIQPIFITIDPARDTPEVVGEFVSGFHPDGVPNQLIGLTGSEEDIKAAAALFGIPFSRGKDMPGGGYDMEHYAITYLFDPEGKPLALLPTDQGPDAVAAELGKWVH
ncbi:SCO family protein [Pontixanthobacter aquaemixtae]|uniref:SCO family protein n=1 Tax=Pontixanthobacter aquaemixtae TaxID=1958940 RepID=A0A844ZLP3_9SPHN|nr:SCO family protein [Pontixanthobacter aquaemixtae]MXO89331.1 SCO family protein [Pontixanthobacter aquaemixtae]